MEKRNTVFIATSLDGYIADKNGGLDWLNSVPNPDNLDMGYGDFMSRIDAIIMGRTTFETVCGFGIEWPYKKLVYVLSNTLDHIPEQYSGKVHLIKGRLTGILEQLHKKGFYRLYIDGGVTIQNFLNEDLIDEMIITIIPVLLGGGIPLFSELPDEMGFECTATKLYPNKVVQNTFRRKTKL